MEVNSEHFNDQQKPSFSEKLMIFKNFPLTNLLMEGVLRFISNS